MVCFKLHHGYGRWWNRKNHSYWYFLESYCFAFSTNFATTKSCQVTNKCTRDSCASVDMDLYGRKKGLRGHVDVVCLYIITSQRLLSDYSFLSLSLSRLISAPLAKLEPSLRAANGRNNSTLLIHAGDSRSRFLYRRSVDLCVIIASIFFIFFHENSRVSSFSSACCFCWGACITNANLPFVPKSLRKIKLLCNLNWYSPLLSLAFTPPWRWRFLFSAHV